MPVIERAHGVLENHHRNTGDGFEQIAAPELVAESGEQQRRGFAGDACQCEQYAGYHTSLGRAKDDLQGQLPLRYTQRQRSFTHGRGLQLHHFVSGTHHHRDHQQCQGQRTGNRRKAHLMACHRVEWQYHDGVDEQAEHDGRCRQQDVVDEANRVAQFGVTGELGQPDAGHQADRRTDQQADAGHQHAAVERVGQATLGTRRRSHAGEQLQVERVDALDDGGQQNPHQPQQAEGSGTTAEHHRNLVLETANPIQVLAAGHILTHNPSLRERRDSIRRARASTMKVTTNNRKPRAISAERCKSVYASLNSLAITEAIELLGIISEAEN